MNEEGVPRYVVGTLPDRRTIVGDDQHVLTHSSAISSHFS